MRYIVTASPASDVTPPDPNGIDQALFASYMKFNEDLHRAGVLVAAEGLNPGGKSARVQVNKGKRVVLDGPFAESKELVGGFYILEVASLDEAVRWMLRCPSGLGFDDVLEIRPLTGEGDLPRELVELTRQVAPEWSKTWTGGR